MTTLIDERVEIPAAPARTASPRRRGRRRWPGVVAVLLAVTWAVWTAEIGRAPVVNPNGLTQFGDFFAAATSPRLDAEFLRLTWDAALVTLAYAVLGTVLALGFGILGGVLASDAWSGGGRTGPRGWQRLVRGVLVPVRSVHEAVYALLLVRILGIDPWVAVLAIGIPFGAVTARVFAQMIDDVPPAGSDQLRVMGAGRVQVLLFAILPVAVGNLISYAFYRFECSIRSAAVLGVIGAAGLGFQLKLSFQSLRYDEIWTLLFALVALCCLSELLSSWVRRAHARPVRTAAPAGRRWRARPADTAVVAAVAVGVPAAWIQLGLAPSALWSPRARTAAGKLGSELWPPLSRNGVGRVVELALETLAMSIIAAAIATGLAVVIAFVAARGGRGIRAVAAGVVRLGLTLARAIPPAIWAFVLLFVFLPGVVPGALALAIYTLGVLGRLLAETVENMNAEPGRMLQATGASRVQMYLYDRLPRVAPSFVALSLYRWEVATRETVVVGVVAAGGLGYVINQQLAAFDYHALAGSLIALAAITMFAELASAWLRRSCS